LGITLFLYQRKAHGGTSLPPSYSSPATTREQVGNGQDGLAPQTSTTAARTKRRPEGALSQGHADMAAAITPERNYAQRVSALDTDYPEQSACSW